MDTRLLKRIDTWVLTYTGKSFFPFAPSQDAVVFEDIAHALSNKCRFSGATKKFYSVAEHSILVAQLVPMEFALEALLHDAAETYLGDFPGPLKEHFPLYEQIEFDILATVYKRFGIKPSPESRAAIRKADMDVLELERVQATNVTELPWKGGDLPEEMRINFHSPKYVEMLFTKIFNEVSQELGRGIEL